MKTIRPATLPPARVSRRFRPAGALTSGGRLTLLILLTGVVLLAQAWQAAHRFGQQHASTVQQPPVRAGLRQSPPDSIPQSFPQPSIPHESTSPSLR